MRYTYDNYAYNCRSRELTGNILSILFLVVLVCGLMTTLDPSGQKLTFSAPAPTPSVATATKTETLSEAPVAPDYRESVPAPAPAPTPAPVVTAPVTQASADATDPVALGRMMNRERFGDAQWTALYNLWMKESKWNPQARNRSSGACGIPQALPCSKIPDMSTRGQITWGLNYIQNRYGTPERAWAFWLTHRWY